MSRRKTGIMFPKTATHRLIHRYTTKNKINTVKLILKLISIDCAVFGNHSAPCLQLAARKFRYYVVFFFLHTLSLVERWTSSEP